MTGRTPDGAGGPDAAGRAPEEAKAAAPGQAESEACPACAAPLPAPGAERCPACGAPLPSAQPAYTARRRWLNAALWGLATVGVRLSGLVRSIFVSRFLEPGLAGAGYFAIAIGLGARAFLETGTRQVVVTSKDADDALLARAFWLELGKGLVLALLLTAFALGLREAKAAGYASAFGDPFVYLVAAPLPLLMGIQSAFTHRWDRDGQHGRLVAVTMADALFGLASLLGLLAVGVGWLALPLGASLGALAAAALGHALARRVVLAPASPRGVLELARDGVPFWAMAIAIYMGNQGVDLAMGMLGAVAWVAPYRLALALVQTVLRAIPGVLISVSLSYDAARNRARAAAAKTGDAGLLADFATIAVVTVVTVALAPACALAMPAAALALYGERWRDAALVAPPLTALVAVQALSAPLGVALVSGRQVQVEARIKVAEALLVAGTIGVLASRDVVVALLAGAAVSLAALLVRLLAFQRLGVVGTGRIAVLVLGAGLTAGASVPLTWAAFGAGARGGLVREALFALPAAAGAGLVAAALAWALRPRSEVGPR